MNSRHGEPTLNEMLSDSIVRAVMEADGIDPQELVRHTGLKLVRRARVVPDADKRHVAVSGPDLKCANST
jgi:hypothetical protein